MKSNRIFTGTFALFLLFGLLAGPACKRQSREAHSSVSSELLKKIGDDYWQFLLEESLYLQMKFGLKITKLPESSYSYAEYLADYAESMLERLEKVNADELSHEEWISFEILKAGAKDTVEGLKYFWMSAPVTPYASPFRTVHQAFKTYAFKGKEDLAPYLNLVKMYPGFLTGLKEKLEGQYERGIVLPREELNLVMPFLRSFLRGGAQSILYVDDTRLERIEESKRKDFQQHLADIINSEVNPRLENLINFISGDYLDKAPDRVGLWQYPEGKEYYRYLVRVSTTQGLTPEQIHQIGLEQVRTNNAKVDEIRKSLGFEGTLDEFRNFLRTDPRFFPKTPEEIGERLISYMTAMSARIDDFFLRRPNATFGVKRLPPELEGTMTFGYYKPPTAAEPEGIYYYNGSNLNERSLLWAEGLIYHELVPGHHFHIASQSENEKLPEFRREGFHTSFTEGWGEYAAWLGLDMGFYQDPYSLCGRYMMDSFISTRLVVDTGMNYLEWPRSKAVKFMRDNLLESDTQIHTETLRYAADIPAQALAYKLGSLKMFELRDKAKNALGDEFDIRTFHDALLGSGSMPLPILEKHIDWFIEQELSAAGK